MNGSVMIAFTDGGQCEYTEECIDEVREVLNAWDILRGSKQKPVEEQPTVSEKSKSKHHRWSKKDIQVVIDNNDLPMGELQKLLPHLSYHAISCKRNKLRKELKNN